MKKTICGLVAATVMGCAYTPSLPSSTSRPDYSFRGMIGEEYVIFETRDGTNRLLVLDTNLSALYVDTDNDLKVDRIDIVRDGVSSVHSRDEPTANMAIPYAQKEFEDYLLKIDAEKRARKVMEK